MSLRISNSGLQLHSTGSLSYTQQNANRDVVYVYTHYWHYSRYLCLKKTQKTSVSRQWLDSALRDIVKNYIVEVVYISYGNLYCLCASGVYYIWILDTTYKNAPIIQNINWLSVLWNLSNISVYKASKVNLTSRNRDLIYAYLVLSLLSRDWRRPNFRDSQHITLYCWAFIFLKIWHKRIDIHALRKSAITFAQGCTHWFISSEYIYIYMCVCVCVHMSLCV